MQNYSNSFEDVKNGSWVSLCLTSHTFGSYNIDVHDYSVRLKAAKKFLADGDKVALIL